MNQTKIEWCDFTWNPLVGCKRLCKDPTGNIYCYAYKQAKRQKHRCNKCYTFEPHLHEERLQDPMLNRRKPAKIFAVSMGDLFGPWVPTEWFWKIINCIQAHPQHTFIILTKYPENIIPYFDLDKKDHIPDNIWIGTSISTQKNDKKLEILSDVPAKVKFASLEPLHGYIHFPWQLLDWVIIGLQTGRNPVHPQRRIIEEMIEDIIQTWTSLFIKNNARLSNSYPYLYTDFPDQTLPNLKKLKFEGSTASLLQFMELP